MSNSGARTASVDSVTTRSPSRPWWREIELLLLVAFVVAAYFTRMSDLSLRGEETRRALVAREMVETGDWVVPRTQGVPLFSRPPLQNWLIAGIGMVRGEMDAVAVRLPSVCAILLTAVLLYGYGRLFLSPLGALAAGAAFASMGQVLELGRLGETDSMFALFVSASLLVWHAGFVRGWSPYLTWCAAYSLVALGTLTKGPQAPVYFVSCAGVYLLVVWRFSRNASANSGVASPNGGDHGALSADVGGGAGRLWRFVWSPAHLAGFSIFAFMFGTWQVAFTSQVGVAGTGRMWITDIAMRFLDASWPAFFEHLAEYPLEMLACLLPWSGLLIVWCNPLFRRTLGAARPYVLFLVVCLAVTFPSVWLPPGSRPRYYLSLYPSIALLIGLAADRIFHAAPAEPWRVVWPIFARLSAVAIAGVGLAVVLISFKDFGLWFAQRPAFALAYFAVMVVLATIVWRSVGRPSLASRRAAVLALASFVAVTHVGVMINALRGTTLDIAGGVAELKHQLPEGTKLTCFGVVHHLFVYHYRDELPVVGWPENADDPRAGSEYFCIDSRDNDAKQLPFPWEKVHEIRCDRHRVQSNSVRVIIGRRTDLPGAVARAGQTAIK